MQNHLNRTTRIIIGGALAVVIWIVGVIIGQEQTVTILNPEGGLGGLISRTRSAQVSLMIDYGNGQIKVYPEVKLSYGSSAFDLLKRIESIDKKFSLTYNINEEDQKVTDLAINNYQSYSSGQQWLVWLNNTLQVDTVDSVRLKSGDVVGFKYIKLRE